MQKYVNEIIKDLELDETECCPLCIFNCLDIYSNSNDSCKISDKYLYIPENKIDKYTKCRYKNLKDKKIVMYNDFLNKCLEKGGIKLYDKWIKKLKFKDNDIEKIFSKKCMENNKDNFEELYIYAKNNGYDITTDFNKLTQLNTKELQILIKNGFNINTIFKINDNYSSNIISTHIGNWISEIYCENDYYNAIKKLNEFLDIGINIHEFNILKCISGIQYEDRPYRIKFIKYLIDNKYIDTSNIVLYNGKMLYDTRVGQCILNLLSNQQ